MSLTAITVLDQQEVRSDGSINIRFAKRVMNGDDIVSSAWHRTSLSPGADIDAQIAAVNDHLATMGFGAIGTDDVQKIKDIAAVCWTPDVIAAWQAKLNAAIGEQ